MDDEALEGRRQTLRRMRWRLRGAWLWPTFAVLTLLDAALLHHLPLAGDGTGWVAGFLLAGCINVIAVASLGGLLGWRLRRRRPDLPKVVADDYAGTAVLGVVTLVFLAVGLAHRPQLLDEREDFRAQSAAVVRYVAAQAPPQYRRNLHAANSIQVDAELYRSCVPGDDPDRWLCVFVDTTDRPATIRLDDNRESNASFGRMAGFR